MITFSAQRESAKLLFVVALIFLNFVFTEAARANFKVSPMIHTMEPKGRARNMSFTAHNTSDNVMPLEIVVFKRGFDQTGKETRDPTQELSVFPKQVILKPNEQRSVRISYKGDEKINSELAYRVVFQQSPVKINKAAGTGTDVNIDFLLRYAASLYVSQNNFKEKLQIENWKLSPDKKQIELTLSNQGNRHKVLTDTKIIASNKKSGKKWELNSALEKEPLASENFLPQMRKTLLLKAPSELPSEITNIDITLE